jgi:glutathione S-transferase
MRRPLAVVALRLAFNAAFFQYCGVYIVKLYGSKPSPYVRRLRLLMANMDYEFVEVDVYSPDDRAMLLAYNPTLKIPMLLDGDQVVLDSGIIYQYLVQRQNADAINVSQQNVLSAIDAANDSFVNLFLLQKSGIENMPDKLFFKLQNERIIAVFEHLDKAVTGPDFACWDYLSISLFAMLDWIDFRSLFDFTNYRELTAFHQKYLTRPEVVATDPR